jgi:ribonuclease D
MISKSITKEEINDLPIGQFEGEIILVDKPDLVDEMVKDLYRHRLVGFDTETRPAFKKGTTYDVSLLQLATEEKSYLIRTNHLGIPPKVKRFLEDENVVKVGAAVLDDLRGLRRLMGTFEPKSFFDLNEELKKVGFLNVGVRNLSAMVLQMRISKAEQVSNWEAATLTHKQLIYAATDAWACLEIFKKLKYQGYLDELFNQL